ncbi:EAL domain-containing protein [Paraburkholderia sp. NMBU_R16]|uniref:putative bifunctional diguanylate cyclase/phosphodiesterase n=1 Tax=Paraburkholderia sp. NMBU_R16 TaxID=2698676 RepID=UPI0015679500|nr:EAL domain-containing protein [Paraburkholderia sp. NMBU_R16]NRO99533.1 EAL domain-containing protein [Paraburkholderia sp. NMBU_R16]
MTASHRLFARQLAKATSSFGHLDLELLGELVSATYEDADRDRRRIDRATTLMAAELAELAQRRELLVDQLSMQSHRLEAALENMSQGLCMVDSTGNLTVYNRNFADMFLIAPDACAPGASHFDLLSHSPVFEDARSGTIQRYATEYFLMACSSRRTSLQQVWFDGRVMSICHQPLPTGGFIETFEDVTELRQADARIAHMALHDPLTDLPNRVLLYQHLQEALAEQTRAGCALLYVDLDRFKTVNDTLGHAIGDALLQQVGQRLCEQVRAQDTVARLGGDEFALLVRSCAGHQQIAAFANRLIHSISQPYHLGGHEVMLGASIGIATAPQDSVEPGELLKFADLALYSAKSGGRGQYCFFESKMEQSMRERHVLELELRKAITREEFELHYQPFINLNPRRINGFEALLRWRSPTRGVIAPDEFIPLAEELGLIVPIGEWVLRQACRHAREWAESIRVAVNLSPVQFHRSDLVAAVRRALNESGLSPHRLELEVTESLMLENTDEVLMTLHQLRALGVSIAMDDFGTGYSSLSYLTMFPFDRIKIDRAFTTGIEQRPESLAVIRAVTGMCASLGIVSTAEGVETEGQLGMLDSERCDEVQGYLFSRPKPRCDMEVLLASWSTADHAERDMSAETASGGCTASTDDSLSRKFCEARTEAESRET